MNESTAESFGSTTHTTAARPTFSLKRWPIHGWIGIILVALFWTLNWSLTGQRTHWAFFPLWLGYCLTVDAVVLSRTGSSMLTRSARGYVLLLAISSPGWWLFELINLRTQNWIYRGAEHFSHLEYFLLCSLSFSTVMPAVFGTAELLSSFLRGPSIRGPAVRLTRAGLAATFVLGWCMLGLLLIWPRYFFPLVWVSVYLITDPANVWLGNRSLLKYAGEGQWRHIVALALGCLVCAFFWEMWNFYSYPKWIYHVPFVDFLRIFEMPLLGYLGYIPFSWELFAIYQFVARPMRMDPKLVLP